MYKLNELKMPKYLSPSSLMVIEKNPNKYYLERLIPDRLPREPQSVPAAVGSAFDAFVKINIMQNVLRNEPTIRDRLFKSMYLESDKIKYKESNTPQVLFDTNVEEHNRVEASTAGSYIFKEYMTNGFQDLEFVDIERHDTFCIFADGISIPIMCKGDAVILDPFTTAKAPLDWKVTGYGSATGQSPKPKYYLAYKGGNKLGPHKDYYHNISIEDINEDWSTQLITYGWSIGYAIGTEFPVYIDQFAIRKETLKVARFRAIATSQAQSKLLSRYKTAWTSLRDGSFLKRIGSTMLFCEHIASTENWWG